MLTLAALNADLAAARNDLAALDAALATMMDAAAPPA